jgi:hypothetical protein
MNRHGRRFAPLWVYLFGLFALATAMRLFFPPAEHSVAANVAVFGSGSVLVVVLLTAIERRSEP